jgi:hypothetical protein
MSAVILAEAWLGAPSSIFWETAAIVVLTVALTVIGILALRTSVARKSLNCSVISRTRLLAAPAPMRGRLQVVFGNEPPLADPYVTVVEIANTGKTSIGSRLFDNGRSMVFDLGADIIDVLSVERTPESSPLPNIVSSGSTIELQPEVIAAGEVIRASVLSRDRVHGIELTLNPLSETFKISTRDREVWQHQQARRLKFARFALAAVLVVEIVGVVLLGNHALNNASAALNTSLLVEKATTCGEVDESAVNLSSAASDQLDGVLMMFNGNKNHRIVFARSFDSDMACLKLQISDFGSNTAEAAASGVNMKDSNPAVQEANRFLADFEKLLKSKTFPQQEADLSQVETLSLPMLNGVNRVVHECSSYTT